ncbi:hypothetical protein B0T11DRAFT_106229 [Plectosphaerella cucumerina]|uniref:Uncharacterized protein n=1 Tax=Plectosphaerella cucumerina TaxID=40658 RepID=A0A8K0X1W2_9PEZI|nr:hypothetical protein B0T11DRAFT_106229 [Plectosphaerella cucumerina]
MFPSSATRNSGRHSTLYEASVGGDGGRAAMRKTRRGKSFASFDFSLFFHFFNPSPRKKQAHRPPLHHHTPLVPWIIRAAMTKRESERSDPDPASSAGRLLRALGISAVSTSSCRRPGPDAGLAPPFNDHRGDDIELDDFACRRRHRAAHEEYTENHTRSSTGSAFTRPPHRRSSSVTSLESAASTSSTSSTSSLWSLFAPFSRDADTARQKAPREVRRQDAAHQVWRDYW